jgi:hypothetical protein
MSFENAPSSFFSIGKQCFFFGFLCFAIYFFVETLAFFTTAIANSPYAFYSASFWGMNVLISSTIEK